MPLSRYLAHAFVLITVVAVSGYATISRDFGVGSLRLGAINAEGLVNGEGGQVGDISLGRMSTIIKPITVPDAAPTPHNPIVYLVNRDEDLQSIAGKFRVTTNQIRWSNPWLSTDQASKGQRLLIPPVPGVVVVTKKTDNLAALAKSFHVDPGAIVDFNYLRDSTLPAGLALVIPNGRGKNIAPPPPPVVNDTSSSWDSATFVTPSYTSTRTSVRASGGSYGNRFAYGYCTWYVATRRSVPWLGDAWQWYGNAIAYGFAVGQKPKVGSIMVTWESAFGHVAYVEAVYPDGSWRVSEMNFVGWAVVSSRTIHPGEVPLIGFIY